MKFANKCKKVRKILDIRCAHDASKMDKEQIDL